jgi:hypothetical protein
MTASRESALKQVGLGASEGLVDEAARAEGEGGKVGEGNDQLAAIREHT